MIVVLEKKVVEGRLQAGP